MKGGSVTRNHEEFSAVPRAGSGLFSALQQPRKVLRGDVACFVHVRYVGEHHVRSTSHGKIVGYVEPECETLRARYCKPHDIVGARCDSDQRTMKPLYDKTSLTLADAPDVLTFAQVQVILGVGKATLSDLLASGEIRHRRAGKRILIPKTRVVAYLNGSD
jgi:excisionase family DNA binding protein